MLTRIHTLLREEALHPGTVDKVLLCQQIQQLLREEQTTARSSVPAPESVPVRSQSLPVRSSVPARSLSVPRAALAYVPVRSSVPAWGQCSDPRSAVIAWYAGTLDRWRRSLRALRPLADVAPADRPRIRQLLLSQ